LFRDPGAPADDRVTPRVGEREDLSGRTLGEFVLRERIDEGGFGAVYRCEQPLLGRQAVVKVLHQRLRRNDVVLQRFMREAQLASRLDHPYAAHVYAFGIEHDDGLFWIAMEMVQGTALNRWLRERGPLSLDQLVPFFECVAEVVQTAHDRGIVHRDLKPSNVMVIERAGRLLPKLLDFGVAKLLDDTALPQPPRPYPSGTQPLATLTPDRQLPPSEILTLTASTTPQQRHDLQHRLTHADSTIGSPPYMSPEQWNNAVTVGPASDLYALAVVAYEALTGRRPFIAATVTEYAELHCNAAVPPLGAGLPAALDRLFERALAKRPEQRWSSALELAAALRSASGVGGPAPRLPRLDEAVRGAWLADAPQPLAEAVAALDGARNLWQARDAAHDLVRGVLRYLVALALAARAQVRDERDDPALLELVRAMRSRDLTAAERVRLVRLVVRPFCGRRGAHPIPELVDLVAPGTDDSDGLDLILAAQPGGNQSGAEGMVRSWLAQLIPELGRALRRMTFVLDYVLVVPRDEVVGRWTGARRERRPLVTVNGGELAMHHPMLLDRKGRVCADLWPLVQVVSPTEGAGPELFVFDGRGRHGARMIAAPAGYEHHDPGIWDWIAARVIGEPPEAGPDGRDGPGRPYLGLAPYAAGDAARFVGREAEAVGLLARLRQRPLQVVVGPSGAGKSSFVHAGVVPGLPAGWRAVTVRPGAAPLAALATRLADAGVATPDLRNLLATAPATAAAHVAQAAGGGTIVVVIDHLEELFTVCGCADQRTQFAAAIAELAASADLPVRVIATLRDDFLGQLDELPALGPLLSPALVLLGNPRRDDLVRIVVEPAQRAGYTLSDPELAHDMVGAVADHPGALALLSFTASRLWELRDRTFRQLTRSAYEAMGGVAGALVRHAEATFDGLSADEQRLAREVFRHLVTADGARAQLSADELRQRLATPRGGAVIDKLVAARLLAMSEAESEGESAKPGGDSQIEVIHDALIDAWPRLQKWIREDVDGARLRDQLRLAARQWHDGGRPRSLVWRDDMLAGLERWLRRGRPSALTDLEAAFVDASRRVVRRARLRRRFGLVAIGFAIAFVVQTRIAQRAAESHLTQVYTERGQDALLEGKSVEALIYLAQAARRGDNSPRLKFMLQRLIDPLQHEIARLPAGRGRTWSAEFSPDGRWIVTTDDDGVRVWSASSMSLAWTNRGGPVYHAVFTPDGSRVLTAGTDGALRIWDTATGVQLRALSHALASGDVASYFTLSVSPDGALAAAIDMTGGIVHVWNLVTGALAQELMDSGRSANHPLVEFSHDGHWLATGGGGDVRIYDATTWRREATIAGDIATLSFDPTGPRIATGDARGDVSIRTVPDGVRSRRLRESGERIVHVAFSPDGAWLVAADADGTDRIWNTQTGDLQSELKNHHSASLWAEFSPSSRLVVSTDEDGQVAISDVALRRRLSTLEGTWTSVRAAHFDPSSQRVIGASLDGTARVWDATWSYLDWATPTVGKDCASAVRTEPDQRFTIVACASHGTQIWDTRDAARPILLAQLPAPTPVPGDFPPSKPAVDADGDRAAIASGNTATIYELPGGRVVGAVRHPGAVTSVAFAAHGRDLVTGSVDGSLRITRNDGASFELARLPASVDVVGFVADGRVVAADARSQLAVFDVARRKELARIDLDSAVEAFRSSSDGHRLLTIPSAGVVSPVVLWDLDKYAIVAKLVEHKRPVFSARFVRGDTQILTAGTDGVVRLWDAATGHLRNTYPRSSPYLIDAAVDPSGTILVTAGGDGALRFWDVSSARMIWSLPAHELAIAGVHFEGSDVVTRGSTGEIARWALTSPRSPKPALALDLNDIVRCLPLRFDDEVGGLVEQDQRCTR
jgi:WD40 repeat protein/serine/threonine protein kinase